ncbi:MAG: hypothetical protein QG578_863, partial [Thermodesulfobacteriota bacterium]|nr:hypothetical protein [Thermodesulfobacteriota bacterium]
MNLLPEDKLLLLCCRAETGGKVKNELTGIQAERIDWSSFLEKAREEGVSPIVFLTLPKIFTGKPPIPGYVTDELKKDYYISAKKNILTLNATGKILDVFNKAGINVIVMKGAALAETAYGNLALRPMSDVDLLVKKEDLNQINEQLKNLGYFPADRSFDDVDFNSTYLTSLDYRNPRANTPSFHIHWHFVNSAIPNESYIGPIKIGDIWHDAVRANIAGTETLVMSPHHLVIHLAEHALRVTHSLSKLIYFCDIDRS